MYQYNEDLQREMADIDSNLVYVTGEIHDREARVAELTSIVKESRSSAGNLQKVLLRGPKYDQMTKELRQLNTKRTAVMKKLKSTRLEHKNDEFQNPAQAMVQFQEEIENLEAGNDEIVRQIENLGIYMEDNYGDYLDKYDDADARKHADMSNKKMIERINAKKSQSEVVSRSGSESPTSKHVSFEESVFQNIDEEIAAKMKVKEDLLFIATSLPDATETEEKPSDLLANFSTLQSKIRKCADRLKTDRIMNDETQIEILRDELETITAEVEAEENAARKEAEQQQQMDKKLNDLDGQIEAIQTEIAALKSETKVCRESNTQISHERAHLRKEFEELVAKQPPDAQKVLSELLQYRTRYEETHSKLATVQYEIDTKQSTLGITDSPADLMELEHLAAKKTELIAEIDELTRDVKSICGDPDYYKHHIEEKRMKRDKLIAEFEKHQLALQKEDQEIDKLAQYSDRINAMLITSKKKAK